MFCKLENIEVSMIGRLSLCTVLLLMSLGSADLTNLVAQEPLDGPNRIFRGELLDNLAGDWKLTRKIREQTVENSVKAEWVFNHQPMRTQGLGQFSERI
jgi:hypothetical protein